MVAGSWRADASLWAGALGGAVAYLLGIVLLAVVGRFGIHPASGIWTREFARAEYPVLHAGIHLPVWDGRLHTEVLIYTLLLLSLLVLAGLFASRSLGFGTEVVRGGDIPRHERAFRAGGSIVIGYFPAMLLGSLYSVVAVDAITATQMIAPVLLVGGFYPLIFGGIGGWIAVRLAPR